MDFSEERTLTKSRGKNCVVTFLRVHFGCRALFLEIVAELADRERERIEENHDIIPCYRGELYNYRASVRESYTETKRVFERLQE